MLPGSSYLPTYSTSTYRQHNAQKMLEEVVVSGSLSPSPRNPCSKEPSSLVAFGSENSDREQASKAGPRQLVVLSSGGSQRRQRAGTQGRAKPTYVHTCEPWIFNSVAQLGNVCRFQNEWIERVPQWVIFRFVPGHILTQNFSLPGHEMGNKQETIGMDRRSRKTSVSVGKSGMAARD